MRYAHVVMAMHSEGAWHREVVAVFTNCNRAKRYCSMREQRETDPLVSWWVEKVELEPEEARRG